MVSWASVRPSASAASSQLASSTGRTSQRAQRTRLTSDLQDCGSVLLF